MAPDPEFSRLALRSLCGEATPAESEALAEFLKVPANERIFEGWRELWKVAGDVERPTLDPESAWQRLSTAIRRPGRKAAHTKAGKRG